MGFHANIAVCHRCEHQDRAVNGERPCLADPRRRTLSHHAERGSCPLGYHDPNAPEPPGLATPTAEELAERERREREAREQLDVAARAHWHELHTKREPTPQWWAGWLARIPAIGGCACRQKFGEILLAAPPPPLDDPVAMFYWGVDRHDDVNAELGKPKFGRVAAAARYEWPA